MSDLESINASFHKVILQNSGPEQLMGWMGWSLILFLVSFRKAEWEIYVFVLFVHKKAHMAAVRQNPGNASPPPPPYGLQGEGENLNQDEGSWEVLGCDIWDCGHFPTYLTMLRMQWNNQGFHANHQWLEVKLQLSKKLCDSDQM